MTERAPYLKLVYSRPASETARPRHAGTRRHVQRQHCGDSADPHFAHWVDAYLQEMYDGIVEQPLPEEIATLIEGISGKSKSSSKK